MRTNPWIIALVLATLLLPGGLTIGNITPPATVLANTACGPTSADAEATGGTSATASASVAGTLLTDDQFTVAPYHDEQHVTGTGIGSQAEAESTTTVLSTSIVVKSSCQFPVQKTLPSPLKGVGCAATLNDATFPIERTYEGYLAIDDATGTVWFWGYTYDTYGWWTPLAFPVVGPRLTFEREMTSFDPPAFLIPADNYILTKFRIAPQYEECFTVVF